MRENGSSPSEASNKWSDGVAIAAILTSAGLGVASFTQLALVVISQRIYEISLYINTLDSRSQALIYGSTPFLEAGSALAMVGAEVAFLVGAGISTTSK